MDYSPTLLCSVYINKRKGNSSPCRYKFHRFVALETTSALTTQLINWRTRKVSFNLFFHLRSSESDWYHPELFFHPEMIFHPRTFENYFFLFPGKILKIWRLFGSLLFQRRKTKLRTKHTEIKTPHKSPVSQQREDWKSHLRNYLMSTLNTLPYRTITPLQFNILLPEPLSLHNNQRILLR